jgi:glycosyltransferase involved in cell wall biosynthesis
MKIGIYNRWWHTMGGGERYAGTAAQVLSERHEVELLSHRPVDRAALAAKLGLDLSRVGVRCVPDLPFDRLGEFTQDYDLFICASFMTFIPCRARHGIMFVWFPFPVDYTRWARFKKRVGLWIQRELYVPEYGDGFYGVQEVGNGWYRWTAGRAEVKIPVLRPARPLEVRLMVGSFRPNSAPPAQVRFSVGDCPIHSTTLATTGGNYVPCDLTIPGELVRRPAVTLVIESDTYNPQGRDGQEEDFRELGIAVAKVKVRGVRYLLYELVFERLLKEWGLRLQGLRDNPSLAHLDTYDLLCPISEFVAEWTRRYWRKDGEVLYPPVDVTAYQPGDKRNIILSVGRFQVGSHEKKFLPMIAAFKRMLREGLSGWELHLAGGVTPGTLHEEHYRQVLREAEGFPIRIHRDVPFETLRRLYAEAKIYWHAAGYGVNEAREPVKCEHFGIAPVEAMAAGCVPVVVRRGGLTETVEHGVSGFHWNSLDELRARTWALVRDDALCARMSAAAIERSRLFSTERFRRRLLEIVERVCAESGER